MRIVGRFGVSGLPGSYPSPRCLETPHADASSGAFRRYCAEGSNYSAYLHLFCQRTCGYCVDPTTSTETPTTTTTATATTSTAIDSLEILDGPSVLPMNSLFPITVRWSTRLQPGTAKLRAWLRATAVSSGSTVQLGPRRDAALTAHAGTIALPMSTEGYNWLTGVVDPRVFVYIFPDGDDRSSPSGKM